MSTIFCCSSISPYRPRLLDHEAKFTAFVDWARLNKSSCLGDGSVGVDSSPYAVQLVRQINYGPQESIRYFLPQSHGSLFAEVTEDDLVAANFQKLNSYKNFRCETHNRFFEVNLYQKSAINTHHWRVTLARPSRDIDLAYRQKGEATLIEEPAAEQEKKHDILSSDDKADATFPRLSSALKLKEAQAPNHKELESSSHPDRATLKQMLRFILPIVGQALGSRGLVALLCLDRVSMELDLSLELESLWEAELTRSNILLFIVDCLTAAGALKDPPLDLDVVEKFITLAMGAVDSRRLQFWTGKARLHEVVKRVLQSCHACDWVSTYGEDILHTLTSGPSEALLEQSRTKHNSSPQVRNELDVGSPGEAEREEAITENLLEDDLGYNDIDYGYDDSDYGATKDYTACDKECGYCGNCDY